MERPIWFDEQVVWEPRPSYAVPQDGYTKDKGLPVRECEECLDPALPAEEQIGKPNPARRRVWRLVGEFPRNGRHSSCKYCQGLKVERKAKPKGKKFAEYNEYVIKCGSFKMELLDLRIEYQAACRRLKAEDWRIREEHRAKCKAECQAVAEEMERVRSEYRQRKNSVLGRRQEVVEAYRKTLPENFA